MRRHHCSENDVPCHLSQFFYLANEQHFPPKLHGMYTQAYSTKLLTLSVLLTSSIQAMLIKTIIVIFTIITRLDPHYDQRSVHRCLKATTAYTRSALFWDVDMI